MKCITVSPTRLHWMLELHESGKEFIHRGLMYICVDCDPISKVFTAYRKLDQTNGIIRFTDGK